MKFDLAFIFIFMFIIPVCKCLFFNNEDGQPKEVPNSPTTFAHRALTILQFLGSIGGIPPVTTDSNKGLDYMKYNLLNGGHLRVRRQARRRSKPKPRTITLEQALNMIDAQKMKVCVCKVVCQLNCNPDKYGNDGKRLFKLLRTFENSKGPQVDRLTEYRKASANGRLYKGKNCRKCDDDHACGRPTLQLIKISSQFNVVE